MALIVTSRTFTDDQNRTLNFPFWSGYDRIKASYTVEPTFELVISASNSVLKSGNSLILVNGSNWEDFGFFAGADISGHYENGSTHNIPAGASVDYIDGNIMHVNASLAGSNDTYTVGSITCDEVTQMLDFEFNLVENSSAGTANSLVDGEPNRFQALVGGLSVSASVTPVQLGNKSGGAIHSVKITRLADVSGKRRLRIDIIFNSWLILNQSIFSASGCIKPWIKVTAYPEYQNYGIFISTTNTPTDSNTGRLNEVGNGGVPEYVLNYCDFSNSASVGLPSIDYNQDTNFEVRIYGDFDADSKFNLALIYNDLTTSETNNLPSTFGANHVVVTSATPLIIGSNPDLTSELRTDGVKIEVTGINIAQFGGYAIISGTFEPNAQFKAFIASKDESNRGYLFAIRCENSELTGTAIRPVWVGVSESSFSKQIIPLGEYDLDINYFSHANQVFSVGQDSFIEDDLTAKSNFIVAKNNDFTRINTGIAVVNTSSGERFSLENYALDLTALPTLPDGTKPINFIAQRNFNLSPTNPNNFVKIIRNTGLDTVDEYGVTINYSFVNRWEYWLQQLNTSLSFYGVSTKNWIDFQTGDWVIGFYIQIENNDGTFENFEQITIKNYDDWAGTQDVQYFLLDGTEITKPLIDEVTKIKFTFTNTSPFGAHDKWGDIRVRSFEGNQWWGISSVYNQGNVSANPLKPLDTETKLKLTYSGDELYLECLFDPTKLSNPSNVTFTGKFYADEKLDANPESRHLVTTKTVKFPFPEQPEDRGETGNCCDCIFDVFADLEDNATFKNHVSSRWVIAEDATFTLKKNGVDANFQPTTQSFPNDDNAKYCTIPWRDVLDSDGRGCYDLYATAEVAGIEFTSIVGRFKLEPFSWDIANNKVMIRSVFNDANLKERINFTNANVVDCLLFDGDIESFQPNTEINNLVKSDFSQDKVKRENLTEWTVNVHYAGYCRMNRLINLHLVGENELFVSDYRKYAYDKTILDKPVILQETPQMTDLYNSEKKHASFVVRDKVLDNITKYGSVLASGVVNASDVLLPNVVTELGTATVTLDSEPFLTLPSGSTTNITLEDEGGSLITPIGSVGSTIIVPSATTGEWQRPSDWLPIPSIAPTEQVFYGLCAVYQDRSNLVSLRMTGNYTVDWGDGVIENFASNVVAHHQYSWASVGNVTSEGFRQALIKVTPQAGQNLTGINLQFKHPSMGGGNGKSSIFIDMVMNLPQLVTGASIVLGGTTIFHAICQRVRIDSIGSATSLFNLCLNYFGLRKFEIGDTTNVTNTQQMFSNCYALTSVPLFNTQNVTNMQNMLLSCYALTSVPLFNTQNVTTISGMFFNCYVLPTVPLFNTTNVTNMQQMLYNCYSLTAVPLFNMTNVTNMLQMVQYCNKLKAVEFTSSNLSLTNLNGTMAFCSSITIVNITLPATGLILTNAFQGVVTIQHLILTGCRYGFNISNNELSATALNDLFTSLGTAVGSQTITITGNPGASTCDTTIATAKGFTVVI